VAEASQYMPKAPPEASRWARTRAEFLRRIAIDSHFHRVFDGLPDIHFFVKDRAGRTLFFSRGLPAHHGLRDEAEMLGKTDHDLTPGPLARKYLADDRRIHRTGEPILHQVEVWMDHVGLPDWFIISKFPIFDRRRRVIGVMGTLRACGGIAPPELGPSRITPSVKRLREDLSAFPTIAELGRICRLSPRQLQRTFHEAFGMSPRTYWMKCRIRAACEALARGEESIADIAARLGFCDQSNFTAHFHKHTGKTPRAFQRGA